MDQRLKQEKLNGMIKRAKNCFVWVNVSDDDGTYVYVSKKEIKHLINTISMDEIDPSKFVIRESGDFYIN